MNIRICRQCKRGFLAERGNRRYCSEYCFNRKHLDTAIDKRREAREVRSRENILRLMVIERNSLSPEIQLHDEHVLVRIAYHRKRIDICYNDFLNCGNNREVYG